MEEERGKPEEGGGKLEEVKDVGGRWGESGRSKSPGGRGIMGSGESGDVTSIW